MQESSLLCSNRSLELIVTASPNRLAERNLDPGDSRSHLSRRSTSGCPPRSVLEPDTCDRCSLVLDQSWSQFYRMLSKCAFCCHMSPVWFHSQKLLSSVDVPFHDGGSFFFRVSILEILRTWLHNIPTVSRYEGSPPREGLVLFVFSAIVILPGSGLLWSVAQDTWGLKWIAMPSDARLCSIDLLRWFLLIPFSCPHAVSLGNFQNWSYSMVKALLQSHDVVTVVAVVPAAERCVCTVLDSRPNWQASTCQQL